MTGRLIDKRVIVVTGKGGVGKTTVAAALALAAAQRGRRTVLAEVSGRADALEMLQGSAATLSSRKRPSESQVGELLWHSSLSPDRALRAYLKDQLPVAPVARLLGRKGPLSALIGAAPGMSELLTMGLVWDLVQPQRRSSKGDGFDLCILDAPASGHVIPMLQAPTQFAETAKVGPVARQGSQIASLISNPSLTTSVVVATAEELPVSEAIELSQALADVGQSIACGVVNSRLPQFFSDADAAPLQAAAGSHPAVGVALAQAKRAAEQQRQAERLREGIGCALADLPQLPARNVGRAELALLADELGPLLDSASLSAAEARI